MEHQHTMNFEDELDAILVDGKEKAAEHSSTLDARTIEIISLAVSAAMRCNHCLELHIRSATKLGIPDDQIAAAVFLAGNLVNASVLAIATRHLDEKREVCWTCEMGSMACEIQGTIKE